MKSPKNLLFVAFQFPPYGGGSAVHRATRFVRYLGESGWRPYVLTANRGAYESIDLKMQSYLPDGLHVTRALALDARRHLSIAGRYLRWSAPSDRWANWTLSAVPLALSLIFRKRIDVILVTCPIPTAVLIGVILQWLTRKPLVVDFRDSMTEADYPRDPFVRRVNQWIERAALRCGSRFVFTARSARQMYLDRYPHLLPEHCIVIANGYDEEDFAGITSGIGNQRPPETFRMVHSGLLYPDERDPRAFFKAVHRLKTTAFAETGKFRIDLRASGSEHYYRNLLQQFDIDDVVHLLPSIPHREALKDTSEADGLLLFQAASCNHQIPAKVYEYLRLSKPILAITSEAGDTAALLRDVGGATIADLTDEGSIFAALRSFIAAGRLGRHSLPDPKKVSEYTRRNGTKELAHLLDGLLLQEAQDVPLMSTDSKEA